MWVAEIVQPHVTGETVVVTGVGPGRYRQRCQQTVAMFDGNEKCGGLCRPLKHGVVLARCASVCCRSEALEVRGCASEPEFGDEIGVVGRSFVGRQRLDANLELLAPD